MSWIFYALEVSMVLIFMLFNAESLGLSVAAKAKNCECNFRTLGLGAGNGRVVDREIQRESLLCPDYLKVPRQQQQQQ